MAKSKIQISNKSFNIKTQMIRNSVLDYLDFGICHLDLLLIANQAT